MTLNLGGLVEYVEGILEDNLEPPEGYTIEILGEAQSTPKAIYDSLPCIVVTEGAALFDFAEDDTVVNVPVEISLWVQQEGQDGDAADLFRGIFSQIVNIFHMFRSVSGHTSNIKLVEAQVAPFAVEFEDLGILARYGRIGISATVSL